MPPSPPHRQGGQSPPQPISILPSRDIFMLLLFFFFQFCLDGEKGFFSLRGAKLRKKGGGKFSCSREGMAGQNRSFGGGVGRGNGVPSFESQTWRLQRHLEIPHPFVFEAGIGALIGIHLGRTRGLAVVFASVWHKEKTARCARVWAKKRNIFLL